MMTWKWNFFVSVVRFKKYKKQWCQICVTCWRAELLDSVFIPFFYSIRHNPHLPFFHGHFYIFILFYLKDWEDWILAGIRHRWENQIWRHLGFKNLDKISNCCKLNMLTEELATPLEGASYFFNISSIQKYILTLLWLKKCVKLVKKWQNARYSK